MAGQDDISDRWAEKLQGMATASAADEESLRKAMAINPALFEKKAASQAQRKRPLSEVLVMEKQKYQVERKLLRDEILKLQTNERALLGKALEKVNAAVLLSDPELTDKLTDEALKKEASFLAEIGFNRTRLKTLSKGK